MLKSIAVIPDGNRRYAEKKGISLTESYEKGFDKVEDVMDWCIESGVKEATFWGLSTENAENRPSDEKSILYPLYKYHLNELLEHKKIHNNRVRVRIVGENYFKKGLGEVVRKVEDATKDYDNFQLNLALAYGGQSEIINAVKLFLSAHRADELNEKSLQEHLYVKNSPDLIIRTSGINRLSGYLMWQSAYSELFFSKQLWPEFSKREFAKAVECYNNTKRNFGK